MIDILCRCEFLGRQLSKYELMRIFLFTWTRTRSSAMISDTMQNFNRLLNHSRTEASGKMHEIHQIISSLEGKTIVKSILKNQMEFD